MAGKSQSSTWIAVLALAGMLSSATIAFSMPCGGDCHEAKPTSCCDHGDEETPDQRQPAIQSGPIHDLGCCAGSVERCDDFPLEVDSEAVPQTVDVTALVPRVNRFTLVPMIAAMSARAPPSVPPRASPTNTVVLLI